ncbi:hypothetical protein [Methanolobus profundi]|uniref:hypothetical protein n=1 Tax=Methanolobus profundi TaxID=487685 RepID=UPI0015A6DB2C|nr:hypothetical protein [Methanolobus profundi]
MEKMTFRQENYIRKSLMFAKKRECIHEYCRELEIPWTDLSKDNASELISKLSKII